MKRLILILLLLFFMSGCSTNYNLVIDNDSVSENVNISIPRDVVSDYDNFMMQVNFPRPVYSSSQNNYEMNYNENGSNYIVNYSYNHDINDYQKSSFISKCYESIHLTNNNDIITLKTSDRFNCIKMEDGFYMDDVSVNIKTDLNVIENNADEVNGNTYTWVINNSNYMEKPINITLENNKTMYEKVSSTENIALIMIILSLTVIGFVIYVFMRILHKNNSKF